MGRLSFYQCKISSLALHISPKSVTFIKFTAFFLQKHKKISNFVQNYIKLKHG